MLALAVVLAPAAALRAPITQLKQGPRRALRRAAAAGPPASRAEDLVANAGDLRLFTPLGPRKPAAPLDGDALAANALSGFSGAMIPEAVAFAFVAGVSPIVGLQTTAVLGFVAAAFGDGRHGGASAPALSSSRASCASTARATSRLVDGLADDGTRGSTRQECVGQGLGNLASGLLGGQGGCALIGQSLINVHVLDHSALEAINDVAARYAALGKTLRLRRLSPDCCQLLAARNGAWSALVLEADADSDPIYEVAVDYSKKGAIVPPKPPKPTTRDRPTGAGFGEAG
ncbi:secondary active sulfate transmembrane transporter [Aureococcus anophagefferens]|nr:secondary active sulfate transmembrane transporter [Aureococcus anophagefferens]